ncbi:hypothetical protein DESAMIL20_555 [Desulfurella amilsii]|uniref:Porin n=1 Tax=Desulfurella amilsii TaxID=1562698 RepID=A0A1X4XYP7_9BACT|nr:hypothetical protein [Desulfurella amilsii]OSS42672.1 hypothetical protein DESAMIL20_555 [Desulfurella amilsii]
MKKRLVSLVAAAALLGSVSIASAGTVTTKGDTDISISGFAAEYLGFANNQSGLFSTAASNPGMKNAGGTTGSQTNFSSTANVTRLRLNLDNKVEGITGEVSADFRGTSGGGNDGATSTFRLRQAWFMKSFCQEGCNYTPWLLIGQTNTLGMAGTYSFLGLPIGGVAGSASTAPTRVPQVAFGVKFDLGSVKLNPEIAVMDLQQLANNYGGLVNSYQGLYQYLVNGSSGVVNPQSLNINPSIIGMRTNMPGFGIKVPIEFNTGLGAPASFYADAQMQTMKVNYVNGLTSNLSTDNNKTSWMAGAGLSLPIYFVTLKGDVAYLRGFTNMSYIFGDTVGSSESSATPPSYWVNGNGSLEQTHATQWDAEAQIDFNKLAQVPFTLSGGYSQVVFSNLPSLYNVSGSEWSYFATAPVRKAATIFANVSYNMTKSTMLGIEYDRNRTNYVVDPGTTYSSNAVYLVGVHNF